MATPEFRIIRLHTRYRRDLTEERTREKQRAETCTTCSATSSVSPDPATITSGPREGSWLTSPSDAVTCTRKALCRRRLLANADARIAACNAISVEVTPTVAVGVASVGDVSISISANLWLAWLNIAIERAMEARRVRAQMLLPR